MRYTLLEAVQLILSSLDSDEVNSYTDTVESVQVANILRSTYYDIASDVELPEEETLFQLEASGSALQPTLMTVPTNVTKFSGLQYNNKTSTDTNNNYREVCFKPFGEFFYMQNALYQTISDVGQMSYTNNGQTFTVMYRSDKMPQWYTTVDDYTILFDSYDSAEDTTLQKSKTMALGTVYPVFTLSDTFAPDLNPNEFSLWINTAKTRAFNELKQTPNQESAGSARRQKVVSQKRARIVEGLPEVIRNGRYGRKAASYTIPQYLKNGT